MAVVEGFKALRYDGNRAGELSALVCPPYDIITDEMKDGLLKKSAYNMVNLELPSESGELNKYENAGRIFEKWIDGGILKEDEKSLYVYEITFFDKGETRTSRFLTARVRLQELFENVILPHEKTLSKAKEDRFNLMRATNANMSPVWCLYDDAGEIIRAALDKISKKEPSMEAETPDGLTHRVYIESDEKVLALVKDAFSDKKLYIADGHHRYETALNYRRSLLDEGKMTDGADYIMMVLSDMGYKSPQIMPIHRLIKNIGMDESEMLTKLEDNFYIEKVDALPKSQEEKGIYELYTGSGYYYKLKIKDYSPVKASLFGMSTEYASLDAAVIQSLVFSEVFGLSDEDMAKGGHIFYTHDPDPMHAINAVKSGEYEMCILMPPTKIEEIKAVCLNGEKMPQKSTYFVPKPISGLFINRL